MDPTKGFYDYSEALLCEVVWAVEKYLFGQVVIDRSPRRDDQIEILGLRVFSCFFTLRTWEREEFEGLIENLLPGLAFEVEGVACGRLDLLYSELQMR